jgi:hypothetical protein
MAGSGAAGPGSFSPSLSSAAAGSPEGLPIWRLTFSMESWIFSRLIRKRPNTRTKKPIQKITPQGLPLEPVFCFFTGLFVFASFRTATPL